MPLGILFEIGKALLKLVHNTYNLLSMGEEDLAPVRQRHRLVPVHELGFEFFLQALDLRGDRRLGQVEQLACFAEAHGFGDGNQCFELADVHELPPNGTGIVPPNICTYRESRCFPEVGYA